MLSSGPSSQQRIQTLVPIKVTDLGDSWSGHRMGRAASKDGQTSLENSIEVVTTGMLQSSLGWDIGHY